MNFVPSTMTNVSLAHIYVFYVCLEFFFISIIIHWQWLGAYSYHY